MSNNNKERGMSTLIRISVLSWSAALLTASYAGLLAKMDPTFIATVFTAAAATFGVDTLKKGDKEEDAKRDSEPATTAVEPTPEPEPAAVASAESSEGCPTCGSGDAAADNSVPVGRV
jgi:Domain of unknown function (DUF6450)